ncbi:methyltransferase domain-containing protein [Methanosphaera sp. ISO3-F5]|uniref:class I SAM-dependent methyltransferase n=1 Tax=Methanosphaera sp. ISO3-F5 TaxID=1452353 RepID=UPI002B25DC0A|nr:methyltransferase domain-containing protein [Methanosphaera sp. ISO3-F5]WQH63467.1 methyltransferase domain-containing protein [Methanosphaera sp. ISO3-F5]
METKSFWKEYYKNNPNPVEASTFAQFSIGFLKEGKSLIELGCGNGRDSVFFAEKNINVTAIDQIDDEINYLNQKYGSDNLVFKTRDFTNLKKDNNYDYVYSRFTLHSITEEREAKVFDWIESQLNKKGLFLLEVRSINDPMFKKGEKLSENENVTTHYRRYLNFEDTKKKLKKHGLTIVYALESNGLSVYKDDDPTLIRIVAKKE